MFARIDDGTTEPRGIDRQRIQWQRIQARGFGEDAVETFTDRIGVRNGVPGRPLSGTGVAPGGQHGDVATTDGDLTCRARRDPSSDGSCVIEQ